MNWDGLRDLWEHSTLEAANAGAKIIKDWGHRRNKIGVSYPDFISFWAAGSGQAEMSWKISPTTSLNPCPPMCQFTYAQDLNASHASLNPWWGLNALAHQDSCYRVRKPNELTMSFSWPCFICCEVGLVTWILSLFCSRSLLKCLMFTKDIRQTNSALPALGPWVVSPMTKGTLNTEIPELNLT